MKATTILLFLLFASTSVFSQDTIVMKTGDEIIGKITEVNPNNIVCQIQDSANVINRIILLDDVFMIKYANGNREVIKSEPKNTKPILSIGEMKQRGREDAIFYYKGKNSGSGWTLATAIVFTPIGGFIPAIACSSTPPSLRNLNCPDRELMKNHNYGIAYMEQAKKIKKKKVWKSYGIGSAIYLLLLGLSTL